MIGFSTALVCVMVSYKQADNSYFRPNSLNIRRERNICRRLCFSTDFLKIIYFSPLNKGTLNSLKITEPFPERSVDPWFIK